MNNTQQTTFEAEFGITIDRYNELLAMKQEAKAKDQSTMMPLEPFNPMGELERPWPATDAFYARLTTQERVAFFAVTRR